MGGRPSPDDAEAAAPESATPAGADEGVSADDAPLIAGDQLAAVMTHLGAQEQHAVNRQGTADRYRLLVTLTGGTAAFLVPSDLLSGDPTTAYRISTSLMLFVVLLGFYYRWQTNVWRLVVVHLQRQRRRLLAAPHAPEQLRDNDWLFAAYAASGRREMLTPDPLQLLTLAVLLLVALGPWLRGLCGDTPLGICLRQAILDRW
jgi:hypothetical protein